MLLNYTTSIDAWVTIGEIQQILAKGGASHFSMRQENGTPVALTFSVDFNGQPLNFSLPCNMEKIKRFMTEHKAARERLVKAGKMKIIDQHAANVGWRIVKDWVEAQMALINVEMAKIEEVFLPYLINVKTGETMAQYLLHGDGMRLLGNSK